MISLIVIKKDTWPVQRETCLPSFTQQNDC